MSDEVHALKHSVERELNGFEEELLNVIARLITRMDRFEAQAEQDLAEMTKLQNRIEKLERARR